MCQKEVTKVPKTPINIHGATPVMTGILAEGAMTTATAMTIGDFRLTPTISGTSVTISVSAVQGTALSAAVVGTWTRP